MDKKRRKLLTSAAGLVAGASVVSAAAADTPTAEKKVHYMGKMPEKTPLFSSAVSFGNLLFIAGKGAHFEGDIKAHTEHVLDDLKKELENAGSSMEKVLKVNVYLNDIKDYAAMNEVYAGKWGDHPPVRTTVAPMGGVPGNSRVEIDCIAYI